MFDLFEYIRVFNSCFKFGSVSCVELNIQFRLLFIYHANIQLPLWPVHDDTATAVNGVMGYLAWKFMNTDRPTS